MNDPDEERISRMAHAALLREYEIECSDIGVTELRDLCREEILRRMDSTADRIDVLPDGHTR